MKMSGFPAKVVLKENIYKVRGKETVGSLAIFNDLQYVKFVF